MPVTVWPKLAGISMLLSVVKAVTPTAKVDWRKRSGARLVAPADCRDSRQSLEEIGLQPLLDIGL